LLDAVTVAVGGDPATVRRDEAHPCEIYGMNRVSNEPSQGLDALALVLWAEEPDLGWPPDEPEPPALVLLVIDTVGELHPLWDDLDALHKTNVLPLVRDWLDDEGVPRSAWWWCCEDLGYFPGTLDVATLAHPHDLRALPPEARWSPPSS
jgi:hypothetical protein